VLSTSKKLDSNCPWTSKEAAAQGKEPWPVLIFLLSTVVVGLLCGDAANMGLIQPLGVIATVDLGVYITRPEIA